MARDAELLKLRDARIRLLYEKMRSKKGNNGRRLHTTEYILREIAGDVFITTRSIERVLYGKKRTAKKK